MATAKAETAPKAETPGMLVPDVGDVSSFQEINQRAKAFWVSTIDGTRSDKFTPKEKLNPFRGVLVEMRYRKPELKDAKDPSAGYQEPKRYYIAVASRDGACVVREEAPNEGEQGKLRLCVKGERIWIDERYAFQGFQDYMPRMLGKEPVACEMVFVPERIVPLKGGQTTIQGKTMGEIYPPEKCRELGVSGALQQFLQIGGMKAPIAMLTEGGETNSEISF